MTPTEKVKKKIEELGYVGITIHSAQGGERKMDCARWNAFGGTLELLKI